MNELAENVVGTVVENVGENTVQELVPTVASKAVEKACNFKVVAMTVGAGLLLAAAGTAAYKKGKEFLAAKKAKKLGNEQNDDFEDEFEDESTSDEI